MFFIVILGVLLYIILTVLFIRWLYRRKGKQRPQESTYAHDYVTTTEISPCPYCKSVCNLWDMHKNCPSLEPLYRVMCSNRACVTHRAYGNPEMAIELHNAWLNNVDASKEDTKDV